MPRQVRELSNIEIDEVSLVDRPANVHSRVAIAKRATEEEITVPEEIFNEDGESVKESELEHGNVVYDGEGNAYMYVVEGEGTPETPKEHEDSAPVRELEDAGVKKSADPFGKKTDTRSLGDKVREDLSKALTDMDRDEVISKALDEVSKANDRAAEAEKIAKSERELRLTKEYVSKAETYNLPVEAEKLGPVLMRMSETMSYEDCSVIAKALDSASEAVGYLQSELGYEGGGDNNDVISQVNTILDGAVSKGEGKISKQAAMEEFFAENPQAYDEYTSSRNTR